MKTTILGLFAFLLLILLTFFFLPGCKKSTELTTINKTSVSATSKNADSVATPPVQNIIVPLTGDQITLVPHYYKSQTADSSYIYFTAESKNSYCNSGVIEFTNNLDSNSNYTISFLDVKEPSPCTGGDSPLFAGINFTKDPGGSLPNGTFPLSVSLNGTTYAGSIVVTTTSITFNWNYFSGVLITPTQISR